MVECLPSLVEEVVVVAIQGVPGLVAPEIQGGRGIPGILQVETILRRSSLLFPSLAALCCC
jgi:hypothetical protein